MPETPDEQAVPAAPPAPDQADTAAEESPQAAEKPVEKSPAEQAAELRAKAQAILAAAPLAPGMVRLKVGPPHETFSYGGHYIGSEFTQVNALLVPGLTQAAHDAGVTLIEEGQG